MLQVFDQLVSVFQTECNSLFSTWCIEVKNQVHSRAQFSSEEIGYGRHMFMFTMLQIFMNVSCEKAVLRHVMAQSFLENIVSLFHIAFDCPKLQLEVSIYSLVNNWFFFKLSPNCYISQTFEFMKRVFRTFSPTQIILDGKNKMEESGESTDKVNSNVVLQYF